MKNIICFILEYQILNPRASGLEPQTVRIGTPEPWD